MPHLPLEMISHMGASRFFFHMMSIRDFCESKSESKFLSGAENRVVKSTLLATSYQLLAMHSKNLLIGD